MLRPAPLFSLLLSLVLTSLVFCVTESPGSAQAKGLPHLVIKQQIHDFKSALEGETLTHTFELMNQGDEPLKIEQVKPDCSCSVVYFDPILPPRGEGKITVHIHTKGFEGPERWVVKVISNDPKRKEAVLDLRANVRPVIHVTDSMVFFSGKKSASMAREIEIGTGLDKPLILTPEEFTLSGKVTYSLSEIEKGKRYRVTFQNVPGETEHYRGFLKLKTNFAEKPEVTLWIIGRFDK